MAFRMLGRRLCLEARSGSAGTRSGMQPTIACLEGKRYASTRVHATNFVSKWWSKISEENRSMLKQSFLNLSVPAVYTGITWLVSASGDIVRSDDETTTLSSEIEAVKVKLDEKHVEVFKVIDQLKEEKDRQKSEISKLQREALEHEAQIKLLRELLAGHMSEIGILWMKNFMKNLNDLSPLSYYDSPESTGLIYWNPK